MITSDKSVTPFFLSSLFSLQNSSFSTFKSLQIPVFVLCVPSYVITLCSCALCNTWFKTHSWTTVRADNREAARNDNMVKHNYEHLTSTNPEISTGEVITAEKLCPSVVPKHPRPSPAALFMLEIFSYGFASHCQSHESEQNKNIHTHEASKFTLVIFAFVLKAHGGM